MRKCCQWQNPIPNSVATLITFYCALRRDDRNGFWGVSSAGMALIAGRIAYGARASQPSVPAEATPSTWTAHMARSGRKKQGRAPSGRRRQSGPLDEARFRPLRVKIAHHRRLRSKQNFSSLAIFQSKLEKNQVFFPKSSPIAVKAGV